MEFDRPHKTSDATILKEEEEQEEDEDNNVPPDCNQLTVTPLGI